MMSDVQPDLFGEFDAQEVVDRTRTVSATRDALTCLIEAHPRALQLLIPDTRTPDTGGIGSSGQWSYFAHLGHLSFGSRKLGWDFNVMHWWRLDALIRDDPRVNEIREWSTTQPVGPRTLYRPYVLWPDPEDWHPSYLETERQAHGWGDRLHYWQTALAVLTDARESL